MPTSNINVIRYVVITVCICAFLCVTTEAICVLFKIPDMNTSLSGGFTHVTDTLIGALIGLLISTKPQQATSTTPQVEVTNTTANPVPTTETH